MPEDIIEITAGSVLYDAPRRELFIKNGVATIYDYTLDSSKCVLQLGHETTTKASDNRE